MKFTYTTQLIDLVKLINKLSTGVIITQSQLTNS